MLSLLHGISHLILRVNNEMESTVSCKIFSYTTSYVVFSLKNGRRDITGILIFQINRQMLKEVENKELMGDGGIE